VIFSEPHRRVPERASHSTAASGAGAAVGAGGPTVGDAGLAAGGGIEAQPSRQAKQTMPAPPTDLMPRR